MITQNPTNILFILFFSALLSSLIGNYLLWNKMSQFGITLSHATLTPLAIALILHVSSLYIVIPFTFFLTLFLVILMRSDKMEVDSLLSLFFNAFMGIGSLILYLFPNSESGDHDHVIHIFFGSFSEIEYIDIGFLLLMTLITFLYIQKNKQELLLFSLNKNLALVQGVNINRMQFSIALIIGLGIIALLKILGILLGMAFILAPAIASQYLSKSVKQSFNYALFFSIIICIPCYFILTQGIQIPLGAVISIFGLLLVCTSWIFSRKLNKN